MDRADPDLDKYVAMSSPLKHRALLVRRKADTRGVLFKAYQKLPEPPNCGYLTATPCWALVGLEKHSLVIAVVGVYQGDSSKSVVGSQSGLWDSLDC